MILYDISREILSCDVYPGDPEPKCTFIKRINDDCEYNLSMISMSSHAGTHIDAPLHFDNAGSPIMNMKLSVFFGQCTVVSVDGILTGEDMDYLLPLCSKRILFKGGGKAFLSNSAAFVLAHSDAVLVGTDAPSIAPDFDEAQTHRELAAGCVAVLENLNLSSVSDGEYTLCAFPLKIKFAEVAPCRAVLLQQEKGLRRDSKYL